MPERIVKQHRAAGRPTDLDRAWKQLGSLQVFRIGSVLRPMAAGNHTEVATSRRGHIGEIVADFKLKQWDRPSQLAVAVVVAVDMPAHAAPPLRILNNEIGGMVMRTCVQQSGDIGPDRRQVEQVQEQRVVVQNIEQPGVRVAEMRYSWLRNPFLEERPASCDRPMRRLQQGRDMIGLQKPFKYQIAVVIEPKPLGGRGMCVLCHRHAPIYPLSLRQAEGFSALALYERAPRNAHVLQLLEHSETSMSFPAVSSSPTTNRSRLYPTQIPAAIMTSATCRLPAPRS